MEVAKILVKYSDGSEREIKKGFAAELKKGKELCIERGNLSEQELYSMAFLITLTEFYRENQDKL